MNTLVLDRLIYYCSGGHSSQMMLPDRVIKNIEEQQYRSEILVALFQFAVVALLATFYWVAPSGHSPDAPVYSVPLGLSLFSILVFVRLWFAYTRQLSRFFLGVSAVAEMAILLFTIWTYQFQFESTSTVVLKNTHVAYVFILIALRALRFEPIWVIISGLTAALGWGLIVWYTLITAGTHIITWDYVTYVSTRSLHPGGEFDKVLAILLVTGLIALVLQRARNTLFQAVSQTHAARDLSRFFDSDVAEKITGSQESLLAGQGETRHAAILFTDMRGFTKASASLTPNALIGLLGEYQQLLVPIIQKHGGSIDKFMGDGILASFGAVAPSERYAVDALNAVDEIMHATKQWAEARKKKGETAIGIGAGLAHGELVFGVIGNDNRLEYTVIGDPVNLAAKLEKHNKAEQVNALTTRATLDLAVKQGYKNAADKETRVGRDVAGVAQPIDLVVLA